MSHVETTADVNPVREYASVWRRLIAFCLDGLILLVPLAVFGHALPVVGGLVVWFFYGPILESSAVRATLGKYLMGLQVVDLSGKRITFKAALIRNLVKIISTAFLFIGCIIAFFSARKQSLHDLLADTVVVDGQSEAPIGDSWVENTRTVFQSVLGTSSQTSPQVPPETSSSAGASAAGSSSTGAKRPEESLAMELERLHALKEKGAITQDEYEAAKKKLFH